MKLRCTHNSIRLRLRRSEVEQLDSKGIQERVHVGPGQVLVFSVAQDEQLSSIHASLTNGHLAIRLPAAVAQLWISTNQVGIETELPADNDETLHLLIEKDFPCTGREDEDKADFFGELATDAAC